MDHSKIYWLDLIKKCREQDKWGNAESCVFCNAMKGSFTSLHSCKECVCTDYVTETTNHEKNKYILEYSCIYIMDKISDDRRWLQKEAHQALDLLKRYVEENYQ